MNSTEEIWKPIKGYEGLYEVSNIGRVKSLVRTIIRKNGVPFTTREFIMKTYTNKRTGRECIRLRHEKERGTIFTVYILVAEHFLNFDSISRLVFKDGDIKNTNLSNLEYVNSTYLDKIRSIERHRKYNKLHKDLVNSRNEIQRKKDVLELRDPYITRLLVHDDGFDKESITKEMIELKRTIVSTRRLIKQKRNIYYII